MTDFLDHLREVNSARLAAWEGEEQKADGMFHAAELGGEVGELLNVVKKLHREAMGWRGSRATAADLSEEIGDVLICLDKLAGFFGVGLEAATVDKFNATSDRQGFPHKLRAHAVNSDVARAPEGFWLIVREPGKVPSLRGPWPHRTLAERMREEIKQRPTAYIDVLTLDELGPEVQHGPEALQMLDGRSMGVGRKHNARVRAAHAEALSAAPLRPAGTGEAERPTDDDLDPHLPDSVRSEKRCGIQRSAWLTGWFVPWSPRNDNENAEGPWSHWVALAQEIIAVDERARSALADGQEELQP